MSAGNTGWQSFGAAVSLANLYMLAVWDEMSDQWFAYFRAEPYQTWPVFFRAVGDLVLLALLFWPLIAAATRAKHPILRKACCAALVAAFVVALDVLRTHALHFYGDSLVRTLGRPGLMVAAGITALAFVYFLLFRDRTLTAGVRAVLLIALAAVPINLAGAAWAVHSTWPAQRFQAKPARAMMATPSRSPRVVWVIFDMWDYDLTFPERRKDLTLPEVDRLQSEALSADQAVPPASQTLESIPSLTLGKRVAEAHHRAPDELNLTFRGTGEHGSWSAQRNIFQDAAAAGVNSAIVGFYHPYARVVEGPAESYFLPMLTLEETPEYWNGLRGLEWARMEAEEALYRPPVIQSSGLLKDRRAKRIARLLYLDLHDRAIRAATRPELGLVFLHLPIPHIPAIYDRSRKEVTAESNGSYADNLALMDRTLGELRAAMEAAGEWDRSVVLVSSDHPLPTRYRQHPRIPFLLKMAGQKQGLRYEQPFNTVLSHDLVLAALSGALRTADDVAKWLDSARLRFPEGNHS